MNNEIIKKLKRIFSNYIEKGIIPDYFMKARLVLLSKDGTNYPPIDKTRPISILPAITKLFELSILNKIYNVTESKQLNGHKSGFIRGSSTVRNIEDLPSYSTKYQKELYSSKSIAAIVFFDLKNAYYLVPREKLLIKMKEFKINESIILIVQKMLNGFSLKFESITLNTTNGLVQWCALSLILFNIFLNDLLNEFDRNKIHNLAYADDLAWWCQNIDKAKIVIINSKILVWEKRYED